LYFLDLKPYFTPLSVELFQLITRTFHYLFAFRSFLLALIALSPPGPQCVWWMASGCIGVFT